MGLFGFGKSKKDVVPQNSVMSDLAAFNEKRGNYGMAFEAANKKAVEKWETDLVSLRQKANACKVGQRLGALYEVRDYMDRFRSWCCGLKYGDKYFAEMHTRDYAVLLESIKTEERTELVLIPSVISKAKDGISRADLIRCFDESDKFLIEDILRRLEESGEIKKEKRGNKWFVFTP